MRVIHVVPAITEEAAGPSYSVPRLCESLIGTGMDVQLAALDWAAIPVRLPYLKTFPLGFGPRRLGVSPKMRRWLKQEVSSGRVEIIHNHSLWMMPNVYPGYAVRDSRCRLVVSPRGTLSAWALGLNALQKKIFWHVLQAPALRAAACFHATSESEYEDIRRCGFRQPVCILSNGIDVPPLEQTPNSGRRQLLFLGRIHPIKGIDNLLRAWQVVEHRFPDWELHIAGPDNRGHLAAMQALAKQLRLECVVFRGPLFGEKKLRAYRAASLFVLPTHSENFGMSVAEALAAGTPAIVTKGAPWDGLDKQDAGWWIDIGVDPLVACLGDALATPPTLLAEMGRAGREWMLRDYSWERIAAQLSVVYCWLLEGGETPPCVRLD
ncbi:glycosyltransferase [Sulfuriflexus mobilis]|uniref:glycosyltransferase n=1 Tax=Sulfuriflexus mobilis TaxID=1811807 RepID=UPI000F848158|nr:glycosyltransferase [Sulfuriflexus mobilis]